MAERIFDEIESCDTVCPERKYDGLYLVGAVAGIESGVLVIRFGKSFWMRVVMIALGRRQTR